jgi:hypothetical protein
MNVINTSQYNNVFVKIIINQLANMYIVKILNFVFATSSLKADAQIISQTTTRSGNEVQRRRRENNKKTMS